jgi:putative DNA primase/helicase
VSSSAEDAAIEWRRERDRRLPLDDGKRPKPKPNGRAKAKTAALPNVTEDGAALEFAQLYRGKLLFDHDVGAWYEWDGSIWHQNRTGIAFQWARELARGLALREPDRVRYVSSKTSFAAGVERFARHDPVFAVTAGFWDTDPLLLGTPSGTVDLRSGRLRPSEPSEAVSKSTLTAPSASADCPVWLRFLDEATGGDTDLIRFLQQWCGYCLSGLTKEHALLFIHGGGGEGKGTFLNTVAKIMGGYAAASTMDTFIASPFTQHTTDLAMLRAARLVTAQETESGRQWAEARVKQLTGGDPVTCRFMRQDNFTYTPQFKLTIVGNHRPSLHNVDDAMRRRLNIVPFTRKPQRPDPDLSAKLLDEAPSILRWMINGCSDWLSNGLVRPAVVTAETADYFSDQDTFAQWLTEDCDCEIGNSWKFERVGELWARWQAFAKAAGEPPGSLKAFSAILARRGFKKHKGTQGVRQFRGISLRRVAGGG